MSLFGSLSLGASSLAAQQAALQVTGNNISNSGTTGYSRQVVNLQPSGDTNVGNNQHAGTGVTVGSITRQVNNALNESLRDASSDQSAAQTLNSTLTQLQTTFGALNDNDLSSQMTSFFNSFSNLANNPTDPSLRSQVISNGSTIAASLNNLRSQVSTIQSTTNAQVKTLADQANSLVKSIADLNKQIAGSGSSAANALLDQRDQDLSQLSQLMNITVVDQGNGNVNVLVGSTPIISGSQTRGIATTQVADASGQFSSTMLSFADNGDTLNVSGGQIGGLMNARDNYVTPAINTIDTIASGLVSAVNSVYSQGQGVTGFSTVTGTTGVTDPTAALNAGKMQTGITYAPTNGTFNLYLTDATTGQTTTQQISVNLTGQGTQTSLNSLAASITAAGGGTVTAAVNAAGQLVMNSSNSNVTFGFGNDTSGVLAGLGVNTFFTGTDASTIAVNGTIQNNSDLLATGRNNVAGSNANAQALALAGSAAVAQLGGKSISDYYSGYIGDLATQAQSAANDVTATGTIQSSLTTQQQSISGVSLDEETINMMQYQRAFEGSARFVSVVDEMMQTVLGLIS